MTDRAMRRVMRRLAERAIRLHLLRAEVAIDADDPCIYDVIDDLLLAILDAEETL